MNTQTEQNKPLANEQDRMVPLPSHSIVPQRDVDKAPILETHHLGIDFGGLTAVEELDDCHWPYGNFRIDRSQRRR